jgi:hypothetical protein
MEKTVMDHQNHSVQLEQLEKTHRIEAQGMQAKMEDVELARVRESRKVKSLKQVWWRSVV